VIKSADGRYDDLNFLYSPSGNKFCPKFSRVGLQRAAASGSSIVVY